MGKRAVGILRVVLCVVGIGLLVALSGCPDGVTVPGDGSDGTIIMKQLQ